MLVVDFEVVVEEASSGCVLESIRIGMHTMRLFSGAGMLADRSCSAVCIFASSSARRRFRRRSSTLMVGAGVRGGGFGVDDVDERVVAALSGSNNDFRGTFFDSLGLLTGLELADGVGPVVLIGRFPTSGGGSSIPSTSITSPSTSTNDVESFCARGRGLLLLLLAFKVVPLAAPPDLKEYNESFPL